MLVPSAEERFRRGLEAFQAGRKREALVLFETAIELERRNGKKRPQARYLSYYGLCLALEENRVRDGIEICRQALPLESYNADLHLNMARALLVAGRRREAHEQLLRGAGLAPGHPEIYRALQAMGLRQRPPIPFLPRANPLNVLLGKLSRPPRTAAKNASR
jgi:predicted Zn-dependent protease